MTQAPAAIFKDPRRIPTTDASQYCEALGTAEEGLRRGPEPRSDGGGTGRAVTRGGGEVIELERGITVYPARSEGGLWRAVWQEAGGRGSARRPPRRSWPPSPTPGYSSAIP
jgi:hypothetical protein